MGGRTESLFGSGARFQMPFGGGLGWWLHPLCRERTARAALFQMAGVWGCLPCRWGLSSVVDAPDFRGGALHPCPWCWVCAALARRRVWPSFGLSGVWPLRARGCLLPLRAVGSGRPSGFSRVWSLGAQVWGRGLFRLACLTDTANLQSPHSPALARRRAQPSFTPQSVQPLGAQVSRQPLCACASSPPPALSPSSPSVLRSAHTQHQGQGCNCPTPSVGRVHHRGKPPAAGQAPPNTSHQRAAVRTLQRGCSHHPSPPPKGIREPPKGTLCAHPSGNTQGRHHQARVCFFGLHLNPQTHPTPPHTQHQHHTPHHSPTQAPHAHEKPRQGTHQGRAF